MTRVPRPKRFSKDIVPKRSRVDLRKIHADGKRILLEWKGNQERKSLNALIEDLSDASKINPAELWKRVRFAQEYDDNDLEALLKLENLTWTHVRKLLTVSDVKERARYARKANQEEWGPRYMACEIEARQGVKNAGGRKKSTRHLTPGTLFSLKLQIVQLIQQFEMFDRDESKSISLERNEILHCKKQLPAILQTLDDLKKAIPAVESKLKSALRPVKKAGASVS
jgi:hypothetical protein